MPPKRAFRVLNTCLLFLIFVCTILVYLELRRPTITEQLLNRRAEAQGEVHLTYGGDGDDLNSFYKDFKSNTNVTSLKVQIWGTGCVVREQTRSFDIKKNDKLPPVERLWISGYDFDARPQSRLRTLQTALGLGPKATNLDKWVKAMDFSQLQDLTLEEQWSSSGTHFYERMAGELSGLQNLSVQWAWTKDALPPQYHDFISCLPPLKSLDMMIGAPWSYAKNTTHLHRYKFPLDTILANHGSKLESLTLHQRESSLASQRRPMLSIESIANIQTSCPHLRHIGIDIDRNGTWPNETLDALMQLPTLTSVSLGLEIGADLHFGDYMGSYYHNPEGLNGTGPWREPRMSVEVAAELFKYLRTKKVGVELTSADFTLGDWGIDMSGSALYFPSWEEGRARILQCGLASQNPEQVECNMISERPVYDEY